MFMTLVPKTCIFCLHSQKRMRVKTYTGKKYLGNAFIIKKLQKTYLEKILRFTVLEHLSYALPVFKTQSVI